MSLPPSVLSTLAAAALAVLAVGARAADQTVPGAGTVRVSTAHAPSPRYRGSASECLLAWAANSQDENRFSVDGEQHMVDVRFTAKQQVPYFNRNPVIFQCKCASPRGLLKTLDGGD